MAVVLCDAGRMVPNARHEGLRSLAILQNHVRIVRIAVSSVLKARRAVLFCALSHPGRLRLAREERGSRQDACEPTEPDGKPASHTLPTDAQCEVATHKRLGGTR